MPLFISDCGNASESTGTFLNVQKEASSGVHGKSVRHEWQPEEMSVIRAELKSSLHRSQEAAFRSAARKLQSSWPGCTTAACKGAWRRAVAKGEVQMESSGGDGPSQDDLDSVSWEIGTILADIGDWM